MVQFIRNAVKSMGFVDDRLGLIICGPKWGHMPHRNPERLKLNEHKKKKVSWTPNLFSTIGPTTFFSWRALAQLGTPPFD